MKTNKDLRRSIERQPLLMKGASNPARLLSAVCNDPKLLKYELPLVIRLVLDCADYTVAPIFAPLAKSCGAAYAPDMVAVC